MIAVVQRVTEASVQVDGEVVGEIGVGLLVLVAIERRDAAADVAWMGNKLAGLRVFRTPDGEKYFELDVRQVGGAVLLVSNFTVAAQTANGRRPSFIEAADPETGRRMFDELVESVAAQGVPVQTGRFQAEMRVSLVNDGPVTVIVQSPKRATAGEP